MKSQGLPVAITYDAEGKAAIGSSTAPAAVPAEPAPAMDVPTGNDQEMTDAGASSSKEAAPISNTDGSAWLATSKTSAQARQQEAEEKRLGKEQEKQQKAEVITPNPKHSYEKIKNLSLIAEIEFGRGKDFPRT